MKSKLTKEEDGVLRAILHDARTLEPADMEREFRSYREQIDKERRGLGIPVQFLYDILPRRLLLRRDSDDRGREQRVRLSDRTTDHYTRSIILTSTPPRSAATAHHGHTRRRYEAKRIGLNEIARKRNTSGD